MNKIPYNVLTKYFSSIKDTELIYLYKYLSVIFVSIIVLFTPSVEFMIIRFLFDEH